MTKPTYETLSKALAMMESIDPVEPQAKIVAIDEWKPQNRKQRRIDASKQRRKKR